MKKILKILLVLLTLFFLLVGTYGAYLIFDYRRIPDKKTLTVMKKATKTSLTTHHNYRISTYNIGFGAYLPDFSFFMDGGKSSWAKSENSVQYAVRSAATTIRKDNVDFALFQEVDLNGTRSYHVNEANLLTNQLSEYDHTFAINYHSSFLFYPLTQPHGKNTSGLATYSRYPIISAFRRSLPISTSLSKYLDLDRAYAIHHIPVKNGKDLVLFNVHLSAYGNSGTIRKAQLSMLKTDMNKELHKGNYVLVGGDFNHNLKAREKEKSTVTWAHPFPRSSLGDNFSLAMDNLTPKERTHLADSARNTNTAYIKGKTYTVMLDGFIISKNIKVTHFTTQKTGFAYSDHEPVIMDFQLLD
ncbi:endonuclease/exonuclease/phosphatase family protein [Streptococcus sciuri]|uniref:Endonuclease/exonuclease/phosphatase family protein n=1 Tax=Streptococcus sciuri TaxID=2973939 RepID=A0ABT2F512_9STRE|nr:endonuclease/exonuclease/phosphatase family protein [Streptococcus sciuri]MCS4487566.1 endonuclease/exonuclease/phosphatase family protein [Streptococcus sciuri]